MKFYYRLQFLSLKRSIEDAGLPIAGGIILLFVGYGVLFYAAKQSQIFGALVLLVVQHSLLMRLNHKDRIDFIRQLFPAERFAKIMLLENLLITMPLLCIAVYLSIWAAVLGLLILPLLHQQLSSLNITRTRTPTPFSQKPFEFIILFRRWWIALLALHVLLGIALYVGNENLPFVLLSVQILLSLQAYDVVENELLVWNYNLSPQAFLLHKVKRGVAQCLLLCAPMLLALLIAYPDHVLVISLMIGIAMLLLWLSVLMKYSSYPNPPGFLAMLYTISAVFTFILIPYLYYYFYKKSIQHLHKYLC